MTVPVSKAEVVPSGGALGVSDGLADTVKPGEVVVGEGSDGSISVRRVDGKVEKRVAVGGSAGVPEDVKPGVGARAGRVESRVGSVVASFAVDAKPDGVVLELVGANGVGVAASTPELVVAVVPQLGGGNGKVDVAVKGIKLGVSKVVKAANQKGRVGGKGVDFDGVFGAGSGLSLKVTSAGVKEVLTLGDRPGASEVVQFRSKLSLTGVKSRMTGAGIEFVDGAGKVAFSAPQGVMWDSSGPADSDRVRKAVVSVVLDGDVLVSLPDMGWLRDPLTVFPVFIDPTINVEATRRVYVEANNPNIAFQTAPEFINGGFSGNTVRTFERLDVSQYAGSAAAVNQAVLHSRLQYCEPGYGQPVRFSKVVSGAGQLEGNAVINGGFEQSGSTPSGAAGWVSRWASGTATRNTGSVLGFGEYGLRMVNGVGGVGWMAIGSQPFAVTGGEALTVKADLRHANGGYWGVVRVEYYTSVPVTGWGQMTDNVMEAITDPIWSNTNGSQAGTVTVPAGMKWGRVTIHHNGPALDVDNVKVLRDANSLLANPGFSAGGGGWSLRSGAGVHGFDNNHGWMNSSGGWNAMASTPVAVVPGEVLTGSADIYSTGGGTTVIRVEYYSGVPAGGWDQFTDSVSTNVHTGVTSDALPWRTVGGVTTVPAGMVWARLSVHHSGSGTQIAIDSARISRANPDADRSVTTWNTQPAVETALPKLANNNYQLVPFDVDVTDWVKGWIDNPATNFGLRMDLDGTGQRCSLAGGWVSIVYNEEPFDPIQPATANSFVNAGFESGGYQWGSCVNPATVAITAEYGPSSAASGKRYGKVVAQNGTSYACQRSMYRTNGSGMRKMTVTAKLKSTQPGVVSQLIIDQQGPPWQGALFAQRQVNTTLNANGWQTVTLSMCETSTQNSTVSAYVGSQTPGAAVFVDDLTITMADDPQTWDQGGCGGQQPINPGGGGGGGSTQPPAPDGAHYFENGVPTTIDLAQNSDSCIGLVDGNSLSVTFQRINCVVVIPTEYGPGWILTLQGGADNRCLIGNRTVAVLAIGLCRDASQTVDDWAVFLDSPGQAGLAFPIVQSSMSRVNEARRALCLDTTLSFVPCVSGSDQQLWFDKGPSWVEPAIETAAGTTRATLAEANLALAAALVAFNVGANHSYIFNQYPEAARIFRQRQSTDQDQQTDCSAKGPPDLYTATILLGYFRDAVPKAATVALGVFCIDGTYGWRFSANPRDPQQAYSHSGLENGLQPDSFLGSRILLADGGSPNGHAEGNLVSNRIANSNVNSVGWFRMFVANDKGFICAICNKHLFNAWGFNRPNISTQALAYGKETTNRSKLSVWVGGNFSEAFQSYSGNCKWLAGWARAGLRKGWTTQPCTQLLGNANGPVRW